MVQTRAPAKALDSVLIRTKKNEIYQSLKGNPAERQIALVRRTGNRVFQFAHWLSSPETRIAYEKVKIFIEAQIAEQNGRDEKRPLADRIGLLESAAKLYGQAFRDDLADGCQRAANKLKLGDEAAAKAAAAKPAEGGEAKPAEGNDLEKLHLVAQVVGAITNRGKDGEAGPALSPQATVDSLTLGSELRGGAASKPKISEPAWVPASQLGKPAEGKPIEPPKLYEQPEGEPKSAGLVMMTEHGPENTADSKAKK